MSDEVFNDTTHGKIIFLHGLNRVTDQLGHEINPDCKLYDGKLVFMGTLGEIKEASPIGTTKVINKFGTLLGTVDDVILYYDLERATLLHGEALQAWPHEEALPAVASVVPSVVPSAIPSAIPPAVPSAIAPAVPSAVASVVPSAIPPAVPSAIPSAIPSYDDVMLAQLVSDNSRQAFEKFISDRRAKDDSEVSMKQCIDQVSNSSDSINKILTVMNSIMECKKDIAAAIATDTTTATTAHADHGNQLQNYSAAAAAGNMY